MDKLPNGKEGLGSTGLKEGRKRYELERKSTIVLFLLPAVILLAAFIIYPVINTFYLSLFKWDGINPVKEFIGIRNWMELLSDKLFWTSFVNNLKIVVLSIVIQLPVGFLIAVMLINIKIGSKLLKTVYFLPMLMSSAAVGILFKYLLDPQFGIFSILGTVTGNQDLLIDVLGNEFWAIYAIIAIICWQNVPFYMVFFLASISTIPEELHDASLIDGATKTQYYLRIVTPMLSGSIKTGAILAIIGSLKYFDLIYVMTNGGPSGSTELMATVMYKHAFQMTQMGYGSTVALALFLIVIVFSAIVYGAPQLLKKGGGKAVA